MEEKEQSTKKFTTPRDVHAQKPAKVSSRVYGATDALSKALADVSEDKEGETLVDIKVHNPLKRITQILQEIKNHQTTTVSLRFTIPLIALPIVLFVAFQVGRAQSLCAQNFRTEQGRLQILTIKAPVNNQSVLSLLLSFFPRVPSLSDPLDLQSQVRTILVTPGNEVISIIHPEDVDPQPYVGQTVLLTGNYSACTQSMTLDDNSNITESPL